MANSLLDHYKLLKKDTPTYGDNSLLSIKEGKLVEPSYPSVISPPSDNTVAQLASTNSMTPVEPTPVKYFPDTTRELPMNTLQNQSITAPTSAPSTSTATSYTPQTEFEKYWKTPVGTEKYNIPLDQFVRVAGLASKYLDPQNPVANDLIRMGNEAYNTRARMEYESPNVLLQRRLHEAQANIAERELGGQKAMSDYISSWPQRELSLKQKEIPKESIDKEFISGMIRVLAPSFPEKAATLQEKMVEAERNNNLRTLAQNVKDAYNEVRLDIAKSGLDIRAEALSEQKRQNAIANSLREREVNTREQDATYVKVEDENGNIVYKNRKELKGGEVAKPKYTAAQVYKAETILRNPKNTKIEDLSAALDVFNEGANKEYAFRKVDNRRYVPGTDINILGSQEFQEMKLPKNSKGQQIRTGDVRDLANKLGVTFNEALERVIKHYGVK